MYIVGCQLGSFFPSWSNTGVWPRCPQIRIVLVWTLFYGPYTGRGWWAYLANILTVLFRRIVSLFHALQSAETFERKADGKQHIKSRVAFDWGIRRTLIKCHAYDGWKRGACWQFIDSLQSKAGMARFRIIILTGLFGNLSVTPCAVLHVWIISHSNRGSTSTSAFPYEESSTFLFDLAGIFVGLNTCTRFWACFLKSSRFVLFSVFLFFW